MTTLGRDAALVAGLLASVLCGLALGGPAVGPADALSALAGHATPEVRTIVFALRLPRLLLALGVGAALALAGAALQTLLSNPLADPFLLGVSGGGAAAATLAYALLPAALLGAVPLAAVLGAAGTTAAVWWMARGPLGSSSTRLILAGIAANAFTSAIILAVVATAPPVRLPGALAITMGSFAAATPTAVVWLAPYLLVPTAVLAWHARDLGLLALGEESAAALGVEPGPVRQRIFLAAAALSGGAVAFAGVIGFVGLATPHLCRLVWGNDVRRLLPRVAAAGAALTALGDLVARRALSPVELPVGVITALLGVPFFVALLRRAP
ncbi:MAG: iron ABC transporter permease [Thermoanaerobaculaceae bacterium]|nr:iron ABC transporter permease [Thermoanaerobaculaceae bacterium]